MRQTCVSRGQVIFRGSGVGGGIVSWGTTCDDRNSYQNYQWKFKERWLSDSWPLLRNHIMVSFLSANENEKIKSELEGFEQPSYEPISIFNRNTEIWLTRHIHY